MKTSAKKRGPGRWIVRKPPAGGNPLLVLIMCWCAVLCAAPGRSKERTPPAESILAANPAAGKVLFSVPFLPQTPANCGPTSIAMVLQYYGIPADPKNIARNFETNALAGVFTVDLLITANQYGMDARWIKGDLPALRAEINADRPVIVFLNRAINPLPYRHFAVVVGYLNHQGRDYLVLHSGTSPFLLVPPKKFSREWKRTGNMMLLLKPKEKKPEPNP